MDTSSIFERRLAVPIHKQLETEVKAIDRVINQKSVPRL